MSRPVSLFLIQSLRIIELACLLSVMSFYLCCFVFISRLFCSPLLSLFIHSRFFLSSLFCLCVLSLRSSFLSNFLHPLSAPLIFCFLSVRFFFRLRDLLAARHCLSATPADKSFVPFCFGKVWRQGNCHTYFYSHHGISITIMWDLARAGPPEAPRGPCRPISSHPHITPLPSAVTLIFSYFTSAAQ